MENSNTHEFYDLNLRIEKEVILLGKDGRQPGVGWVCGVEISSYLKSDYISLGADLEITIGDGDYTLDRLLESCITTMHLEEESRFSIPQQLGLNKADFNVTIRLKSCIAKPYIFEWSDEEKLKQAHVYKAQGIELFKNNRIDHAFVKFSKAVKMTLILDSYLEQKQEENDICNLRIALYNNLASCQLHVKDYVSSTELSNKSINVVPNAKAYFRRALCNIEFKKYEDAEKDLINLLKMEPKNKAAQEKLKLVRSLDKKNRESYKATVRKMFS